MTAAGSPAAGAAGGSDPARRTPEPEQSAQCSAETDGPAVRRSHPVGERAERQRCCIRVSFICDTFVFLDTPC